MRKTPRIPQIPKNTDQATGRWMLGIQKAIQDAHQGISQFADYMTASPIGAIMMWASPSDPPNGFYLCDGSVKSRLTDADLYESITALKGTFTVTIASPGVVTIADHGLVTGDCVELTTTGALPTGLSVNTNYYVIYIDEDTFGLATTYDNAIASTDINTSGTQSGVHSLRHCPWGISGADDFLLPDLRGIGIEGVGEQDVATWGNANYKGGLGHYKQDQMQGHGHTASYYTSGSSGGAWDYAIVDASKTGDVDTIVSDPCSDGTNGTPRTGQVTVGPRAGVNFIIKYSIQAGVNGTNGVDGDDGTDGEDGIGLIIQDSQITYDVDGNITQIDYADGQSKVITYNGDGSIDTVVWDRKFETITKEMAYTDGDLSAVDVTVAKIGAEGRSYSSPKRQTVLTGKLNTTVNPAIPSCLEINGSNIDIKADTTEPMIVSLANGYDQWGADDYIVKITADVASAWGSFAQNQRYFLYIDVDDDGVVTYGKTIIPPQYGTFNYRRHSLLHFEGDDESTTFTDEWGNTWTPSGTAKIDTENYKFGTASFKNATGSDIETDYNMMGRTRWTMEVWVRPTDATLLQTIFKNMPTWSCMVQINASGYLILYASSNGSSWNLAAATGTALGTHALADGTWCHVAVEQQYDEANDQWVLKVYKDGVLECYSSAYTSPIYEGGVVADLTSIGSTAGSSPFIGWMDEFRYTIGACRYGNDFTVATSAFGTGDGDIHWFNIDRMEMNVGYPGAWTKKKRVFVAEAATAIDSTTIERLTIYCYQNSYRSEPIGTYLSTSYVFEHNCGIPWEGGMQILEYTGMSYHMSPCYADQPEGATGYGRYTHGYGYTSNPMFCENWRHSRFFVSSSANIIWDASAGWRTYGKRQIHLVRSW